MDVIYTPASATLLILIDPIHHLGLCLALGTFRSSPVESLYAESGLPSLSRHCILLSFRSYIRLHHFSTSKITIPQAFQSSFSFHPRPLSVRMHSLLSYSPFLDLNLLPLHTHSFPPWLIPTPSICSSALSKSPSLVYQLTSYKSFFLNTLLLIIIASLYILMALNPNMALVLPFCSPLNTSSSNYQE